MSYDLYFKSRPQDSKPDVGSLRAHFLKRKDYEVGESQAFYANDATGVYFTFDFEHAGSLDQPDLLPVTFNLNFVRPHIFGLEAEPEVSAFVRQFNLLVVDPQNDGMGEGEYNSEGFLRGWNAGNEFGYRAVLQQNPDGPILMESGGRIESCWRWNAARNSLQEQLGESVFVPRIVFLLATGKIETVVVWGDGIPIAMPPVDAVLVPRKVLAPSRFFRRSEDIALAKWQEVTPVIRGFPVMQGALPYRLLSYASTPHSISTFVKQLQPLIEKPEIVSVDKILNAELVEKCLPKQEGSNQFPATE